ncbi:hypothetical protein GCM10011611_36190 [Aliidongia dinghuensis]|uniref:Amine oxidase domain-containing protein n=1 Tax=Aliidongia dinghuensis TaxID=1867774 RepID=A0A8J2YW81_9PROT|nr:FAD-dependent oxidoreductase [Aliidongia dinghuensis]GGF26940.1 hypothetical protein GCM10011611_36190 [Aliidongia dinghuensis]
MLTARFGIVGGGLSGLWAAALLEEQGIDDYVLLEAREMFGGRIRSEAVGAEVDGEQPTAGCFDLGATWFWPALQPELAALVSNLGLDAFEQYEAGDMLVDRSELGAPSRVRGYLSSPASMRIAGGMGALVDAIRRRLKSTRLMRGQRVRTIRHTGTDIALDTEDAGGRGATYRVAHVLLAVPPRLATATIEFMPSLPDALALAWRQTGTWMAPHAKYVAIYDAPFWRDQGLSGEARSMVGPLAEIHDASAPGGDAALFGFFGIASETRRRASEDMLRVHCRAQLARLFGASAAMPKAELLKDWAGDPYTATVADLHADSSHADAPEPSPRHGIWRGRIVGIASEWSPRFPGYVAGAVEAAGQGVAALTSPEIIRSSSPIPAKE